MKLVEYSGVFFILAYFGLVWLSLVFEMGLIMWSTLALNSLYSPVLFQTCSLPA